MKKELYKDIDKIHKWLKKVGITDYTINPDFSVDVSKSVYISEKKIKRIPLQFGTIKGIFDIDHNELTSLEGCPKFVYGDFSAKNNQLKTLEFCPLNIDGFLIISSNKLTDFTYCPEKVSGDIISIKNPITSLLELTTIFNGTFQYHHEDNIKIPHFEQFYDDNVLTLTHEELKSVQLYLNLSDKFSAKSQKNKSIKI